MGVVGGWWTADVFLLRFQGGRRILLERDEETVESGGGRGEGRDRNGMAFVNDLVCKSVGVQVSK